jgi:hypothetical protein
MTPHRPQAPAALGFAVLALVAATPATRADRLCDRALDGVAQAEPGGSAPPA